MERFKDAVQHNFAKHQYPATGLAGVTFSLLLVLSCLATPDSRAQTLLGNGDTTDSFGARNFVELDGSLYFTAGSFASLGSIWNFAALFATMTVLFLAVRTDYERVSSSADQPTEASTFSP